MEETAQTDQDPAPRPRVWTAFVAWAVALTASVGLYLSAGTIAVIVQEAGPRFFGLAPTDPKAFSITSTPAFVLFITTCTSAEYLGLALVLAALSPRPWRERLRLQPSQAGLGAYLVAATAYLALCECADVVGYACDWKESVFARTVVDAGPAAMAWGVVVVGAISSLGMELLYRGYVQTRLVERWGRWPGILVTSVLAGVSFLDLRH